MNNGFHSQNGIPRCYIDEIDHPHPFNSLHPGFPPGPIDQRHMKSLFSSPGRVGLPESDDPIYKRKFSAHAQIGLGNDCVLDNGSTVY